ncbi:RING-type domain-containing protein [Mycena indigotica]|uniref:RING-type domain-containing protein n=1 Tax=Mycena indigotica TaxID=2126181 RepID=A0A8H6S6L8_9AGAR|nr:RING-type domain-containing protein [Mycena indigotica]KAF7292767.1 RING-type domain-containing protein [Mycena indigotica]
MDLVNYILTVCATATAVAIIVDNHKQFFQLTSFAIVLGFLVSGLYFCFLVVVATIAQTCSALGVHPQAFPPIAFSQQWINTTKIAFYHPTSPSMTFVMILSPTILASILRYQKHYYNEAHKTATLEILAAELAIQPFQKVVNRNTLELTKTRTCLSCPLCQQPFERPQTLTPCGHTFDLLCLQKHLRNSPPSLFDVQNNLVRLPSRQKLCPSCRVPTMAEPAPAWFVKCLVDTAAPPNTKIVPMHEGDDEDGDDTFRVDPWIGIYKEKPVSYAFIRRVAGFFRRGQIRGQ